MKLKVFLLQTPAGHSALITALQALRQQALPAAQAYALARTFRGVLEQVHTVTEIRNDLVKRLGQDGVIEPNTPAMKEFDTALNALACQDAPDWKLPKVRLPATVTLSAADWELVEDFVELEPAPAP